MLAVFDIVAGVSLITKAVAAKIRDPTLFVAFSISLVFGSMALILSGRVLVRILLRNPRVSMSTKGALFTSSLVFCGVDNEGGTAAGVGGMISGTPSEPAEVCGVMAPAGDNGIVVVCEVCGEAPSGTVVVVFDFSCGKSHCVDERSSLLTLCSVEVSIKLSQFGGVNSPSK